MSSLHILLGSAIECCFRRLSCELIKKRKSNCRAGLASKVASARAYVSLATAAGERKKRRSSRAERAAQLLKSGACASLAQLKQAHAHILRSGLHANASLASRLLSLYASSAPSLGAALRLLSSFPRPSLPLFNAAARALSKSPPRAPDALRLYRAMTRLSLAPDNFTLPFLLNSCAALADPRAGAELHSRALRTGLVAFLPVANALVDMYGKCAALDLARRTFDDMPARDVVSFNAMLGAHARLGLDMASARALFDGMPWRNTISWNAMVVGFINAGDLSSARAVFDTMPVRNAVSWTVMIVGYSKNGLLDAARALFEAMPERNLVSWTVMITGYAQSGRPRDALTLFCEMERVGVEPDAATMTGAISSAAQLGGIELVRWIGSYVDRKGIEKNERVLTALVDMHAKCGNVEEACRLFGEIPYPDAFSYTALINSLASHGHGLKALEIFRRMQAEAVKPDPITFIGVLTACSHAGLVDEGLKFWESMVQDYGIGHEPDHYACLVDMLARSGRVEEAFEMARSMPTGPHPGALGALLAACRTYGNVEIAESVATELFKLEPENTGNYVLLSSIYASKEQWKDAARVRALMKAKRAKKLPGFSWVEDKQRGQRLQVNS